MGKVIDFEEAKKKIRIKCEAKSENSDTSENYKVKKLRTMLIQCKGILLSAINELQTEI